MNKTLRKADLFGIPVGFTVGGDEMVRSRLGGVASLCLFTTLLACASLALITELSKPLMWTVLTTSRLMSDKEGDDFEVYKETNLAEALQLEETTA
jgi:hypothetical protein